MIVPAVLVSTTTGKRTLECHELALPSCCPVSKNPFPGSTVTITYRPDGLVLEVGKLYAYIHQFQGGLHDDEGTLLVRDMEGMVQRIADDCAQAVGVPVRVVARLEIIPRQKLCVVARGYPVSTQ